MYRTRKSLLFSITLMLMASMITAERANAAFVDDLVSYWQFDGNLTDVAGGHNGTYVGNTTDTYATGMFGSGIDLDGGSEYIQVNDESAYDFAAAGNGFTISLWTKVNAFDGLFQTLIAKGEGSEFRVHRRLTQDNLSFAAAAREIESATNVNDGQFHHVVAIFTVGPNRLAFYVDGIRVDSGFPGQLSDNDLPLAIGDNIDPAATSNRQWEGIIDDVGIWGRALTDAEVQTLWANGQGASIASVIPEPTSLALLGLGGVALLRRRSRARRQIAA